MTYNVAPDAQPRELSSRGEKLLTQRAVREKFGGVTDMTLYRWRRDRGFPRPVKLNNRNYYHTNAIGEWLSRNLKAA